MKKIWKNVNDFSFTCRARLPSSSCYRPQTKFAKVMFLQVSVCPHWEGGMRGFIWEGGVMCGFIQEGACAWFYLGGHAWFYSGGLHGFIWGDMHGFWGGVHGFIWGACMVLFGGHAWFYLGCMCGFIWGGACMFFSVFSDTMRYGQWAGGTHPTGMHSCKKDVLFSYRNWTFCSGDRDRTTPTITFCFSVVFLRFVLLVMIVLPQNVRFYRKWTFCGADRARR